MKPIRILQVVEMINENSGVSSVVMNYYRHMDHSHFIFDFMTHTPVTDEIRKQLEETGSVIYEMPALTGRNIPRYKKKLDDFFLKHQEYEMIHGHLPNAAAFYLSAAKKHGIQTRILHSHNSKGADSLVKRVRNYVLNGIGVSKANVYFACSDLASDYLFRRKKASEIKIIHNAIDIDYFFYREEVRKRLREKYKIENKLVIGHMGRFVKQKNHRFILEIAKQLKEIRNDFVFLLVGDGPLRFEMEEAVKGAGMQEYFIFTGSVLNPQDYYQMMDVFILPSIYEGLPVVGVEAQACGLPCLFSDAITDEVMLTEQAEKLELRDAALWAGKLAETSKIRYKENADVIKKSGFDIKTEAKRLEEIYLELIGK